MSRKRGKRGPHTTTEVPALPKPIPFTPDERVTHKKQRAFLIAYAAQGTIAHACHTVGISRETHYRWLKDSPTIYGEAVRHAHEHGMDQLEQIAMLRGFHGSDVLIIFLLKGGRPEKYRDRHELTGPGGAPLGPLATVNVGYHYGMEPPPSVDDEKAIKKKRDAIAAAAAAKKP